jgi:hypothetical protein
VASNIFTYLDTYTDLSKSYIYGVSAVDADGTESPIAEAATD